MQHLERLRRSLLDLGTMNRLIHFPHSDRGRNYVRVVDEIPEVLYQKLMDGRELRLLDLGPAPDTDEPKATGRGGSRGGAGARSVSVEEVARRRGIEPAFELPPFAEAGARRHTDDAIQTLLFAELAEKSLAKIADLTRSAQEEQGVHTLFAAFGFLEWYERDDSDVARFGPLVLFPLEMARERKPSGYLYKVSAHDEEPETNIALSERLSRDFGIRLPRWSDDSTLASYFEVLAKEIQAKPRWRLHRWITIANFSSARVAMFHDLNPEHWPDGHAPHEHPTFQALTVDRSEEVATRWSDEDVEVARIADELDTLIMDADTSQVAAVLEAMEPRNLVIKGPPGTGKSQTIANLIAAALAKDLKVLFVAEKMAALEVVKDRLDKAGLGEFCLELHSVKATRKSVMESLAARLGASFPAPDQLGPTRERLRSLRSHLNEYVAALNAPVSALGKSAHELIWDRESARSKLGAYAAEVDKVALPTAPSVTAQEVDSARHITHAIRQSVDALATAATYGDSELWREVSSGAASEAIALQRVGAFVEALRNGSRVLRECAGASIEEVLSWDQALQLLAVSRALPASVPLQGKLLARLREDAVRQHVRELIRLLAAEAEHARALVQFGADLKGDESRLLCAQTALATLQNHARDAKLTLVRAHSAELLRNASQAESALERSRSLLTFLNVPEVDAADSVLALIDAFKALQQAGADVPRALRDAPATADAANLGTLQSLSQEASHLRAQRAQIDAKVALDDEREQIVERGEEYALALRRPIWFAWLFGAFWAARKLCARISRSSGKGSGIARADDLIEARRVLVAERRFEAREDVRALAGAAYRGVATDFDLFVRACNGRTR